MSYYPPNYKIEVKATYSDYDTGERKELFAHVSCQELNSETEILRYFKAVLKELRKKFLE